MPILNQSIQYKKQRIVCRQAGMTYIELIVVLSIFSVLSSVAIFNYGEFQARIDIGNLASDIALKIVEAQKASSSGKLPPSAQLEQISSTWKPSYGIYVNPSSDNKSFIYFTDLENPNQNGLYDTSICPGNGECLEQITILKGNSISDLNVLYVGDNTPYDISDLTLVFKRPNSAPIISSSTVFTSSVSYVEIVVASPKSPTAKIKVYPSGRVQID